MTIERPRIHLATALAVAALLLGEARAAADGSATEPSLESTRSRGEWIEPNPYGATPRNPFAPGPIEAAHDSRRARTASSPSPRPGGPGLAGSSPPRPAPAASEARLPTPSGPALSGPAAASYEAALVAASPEASSTIEPARPEAPRDTAALAAHAATRPAPVTDDRGFAALDAVLADDTADPISGVHHLPAAPAEDPAAPSRAQVREAIAGVTPAMRACATNQRGRVVEVHATFSSNGRVLSAVVGVGAAHVTPAQRSCMARAARGARTPAFRRESFDVTFPVRL